MFKGGESLKIAWAPQSVLDVDSLSFPRKLSNLLADIGCLHLRLRQWQPFGHSGPLVAGAGEPGVFHPALSLLDQLE